MMRALIATIIILSIIPSMVPITYADSENMILWAPKKMIVGEEYEGLVILKEAMDKDVTIKLATNNNILELDEEITIKAGKNHGIFKIIPKDEGEASIFAISDEIASIDVNLYKTGESTNRLKIILQNDKVKTDKVFGYIFLLDELGMPVKADKDIEIDLISDKSIKLLDKVKIEKGEYYTSFIARVEDSGAIHAIAEGIRPDTARIEKVSDDVTIELAVAPHIAMPDSKAYFYLWLEKDGRLYIPDENLDVVLSTSDVNVASFTIMFNGVTNSGIKHLTLNKGQGYVKGELFTRDIGNATITALIEGLGMATTNLIVGALEIEEVTISRNQTEEIRSTARVVDIDSKAKATDVISFVYPSIISKEFEADGIVALYSIAREKGEPEITIG
ncbi:MAG: hypothetical protein D6752_04200, partial [Candidatus Nitrosothermus koennekii]